MRAPEIECHAIKQSLYLIHSNPFYEKQQPGTSGFCRRADTFCQKSMAEPDSLRLVPGLDDFHHALAVSQ